MAAVSRSEVIEFKMNTALRVPVVALIALTAGACATPATQQGPARLVLNEEAHSLQFLLNDQEAFVYQFAPNFAIPHVWPLNSPSGKSLLVQKTEPFSHHRSLWIVDKVQLNDGVVTDFYHEWSNYRDKENPEAGHHSFIRHESFSEITDSSATANLTWVVQEDQPVLDQTWHIAIEDRKDGQYVLDMSWELTAAYGPVKFHSDWVHYAWPYLRMDPTFSGEQGGIIASDDGRVGQKATNDQYANWMDYSNTINGVTEGLTVFTPQDGKQRKWLTREYGTFGPRRPNSLSGSKFVLEQGESLTGSVHILVHKGGVASSAVGDEVARCQ